MQSIPSLFTLDPQTRLALPTVTEACRWVPEGFGLATRKWKGWPAMIRDNQIYRHFRVYGPRIANPPAGFVPAGDPAYDVQDGWMPCGDGDGDRYYQEAMHDYRKWCHPPDDTYELVGPHIENNAEGFSRPTLVSHTRYRLYTCPVDYDDLKQFLRSFNYEGVVWYHREGRRMAKVRLGDFGVKRRKVPVR
jgi:hypothetical protein